VTRHKDLNVTAAVDAQRLRDSLVAKVFEGCPDWMMWAALAALHDLRPDLVKARTADEAARHGAWLNVHLWKMPRDDVYFVRLCHLLKLHGVGSQWGVE
jgi:hypothetical protein